MKNRREMLKPAYANMSPPFAANHFTDAAFSAVIQSIWRNASPNTRPWYDQGAVANGDNWIILWMLYHACRYRDARNSKATSRNFHDDDDLDDNASEGSCSAPETSRRQQSVLIASGSSTTPRVSQATRNSVYYDAARDGYRR